MGNFYRGSKTQGGDSGFRGRRGSDDGPSDRRMYQATCANCGDTCEVPFRPTGDKPVYCRACFRNSKTGSDRRSGGRGTSHFRDGGRSNFGDKKMYTVVCAQCGNRCEVPFRPTGDKPVYCADCFGKDGGKTSASLGGKSAEHIDQQFAQLNDKLDKILQRLTPSYLRPTAEQMTSAPIADTAETAVKPKKATKKKAIKKKA